MAKFYRVTKYLAALSLVFFLAGCSTSSKQTQEFKPTKFETADVVVIGGGGAGMAAAVEAVTGGAKVIVLEKADVLGGNTNFAEGIFGVESSLQKALGIKVNLNQMLRTEYEFQNYKINSKLWELVGRKSADTIEWLLGLGVDFATVSSPGGGEKTWHVYADADGHEHGAAMIYRLQQKFESMGGKIMYSTPGVGLVYENGKITGVNAIDKNNTQILINTKVAVIATGGFGANEEMVRELTTFDTSQLTYRGTPGMTGDGINMAVKIGAYLDKNSTISAIGLTLPGSTLFSPMSVSASMEPTNIWINQDAERYVHEDVAFIYTLGANAIQTQQKTFSVYDSNSLKRFMEQGVLLGWGVFVQPGQKLPDLQKEVDAAIASGNPRVFKADTLEQLAEEMGLDKARFVSTVNNYNSFCDNGEDLDYGKDKAFLVPVKQPPFYGFHISAVNLNSMGGLRINIKGEVLNDKFEPMSGLYAAGMDVSGFTGETYGMVLPGSCQGIAVNTGRLCAESALAYIGKK